MREAARPSILLAEDDETVRLALQETLELEGWRVEACADGHAALERLEGGARYDLLLFDVEMPGVSGLELTRRARGLAHRRRAPVRIVSASEAGAAARRAGADAFLRKPEDIGNFVVTVVRLLSLSADR